MRLDNRQIYDFLVEQNVTHLHHANSLATALTFVQNGGLLSREAVETRKLFQTTQLSDDDDKQNGVWNDVFFDTQDLHGTFPRQNLYGPVLFKFNVTLLLNDTYQIYITKNNPMFWNDRTTEEEKYFQNMDDVRANWHLYQVQRKMITLRFQNEVIHFDQLESIIVDNPQVTIYGDTVLFNVIFDTLTAAVENYPLLVGKVSARQCQGCYCHTNYLNQYPTIKLAKFFLPNNHARFNNQ